MICKDTVFCEMGIKKGGEKMGRYEAIQNFDFYDFYDAIDFLFAANYTNFHELSIIRNHKNQANHSSDKNKQKYKLNK